jgi:hypothetical protein
MAGIGQPSSNENSYKGEEIMTTNQYPRGARVLALALCLSLVACSTSWITQAEAIVQVLLPAATNILTLVSVFSGKSVDSNVVTDMAKISAEVNADLNQLASLISDYGALPESQKATQLDKISAVLSLAQQHVSNLMAAAHIKDPALQAKVNAAIELVISELRSIEQLIPIVQEGNRVKSSRVAHAHPPLAAAQLKSAFNATISAPTGNADLDQTTRTLVLK